MECYIIVVVVIIIGHTGVEVDIHRAHAERESIIKQIECVNSEYEDITRQKVIEKAYDWNKNVYSAKYWVRTHLLIGSGVKSMSIH